MEEPDALSPSRASVDGDGEPDSVGAAAGRAEQQATFRTETYSTIGSSAASISDSARAIITEDIQDVLEDAEAHNADVVAAEHRRVDGWSTVRFHAGAFFEQFVYQVFYPFAIPITLALRGKQALYNMRMVPRPEKNELTVYRVLVFILYFINNLSTFLAISAVTLWIMRFYSNRIIGEDLSSTADAAYWRSIDYEVSMVVFNIVFQRSILALKYAYLPSDDYEQLMTKFVPLEVLDSDQLLSGWTDVPTGTIKKEVAFSAARLGIVPGHVHMHLSREQYRQFISGLSAKALEMMMGLCQSGVKCSEAAFRKAVAGGDRARVERALNANAVRDSSKTLAASECKPANAKGSSAPPIQAAAVSEAEVEVVEGGDKEEQGQGQEQAQEESEGHGSERGDGSPSRDSPSDISSAPSSVPAQPALDTELRKPQARGDVRWGDAATSGTGTGTGTPVKGEGKRTSIASLPSSITGGQRALSPSEQERKARPVVLPVDMLCTAIFAHANTMTAAYAGPLSKMSVACGLLVGFLPMIVRASWSLPVIGRGAVGGFIALCTAITNTWLLILLLLYLQTGVLDYERRQKCFALLGELATRRYGSMPTAGFGTASRLASTRMLPSGHSNDKMVPVQEWRGQKEGGESGTVAVQVGRPGSLRQRPGVFVPPRLERRPSTLTSQVPPTLQPPILSLDSVSNIRAWLLSRRVLSGIGMRYFRRLTIIASVSLLFVALLAVAIIAQLMLQGNSSPSRTGGGDVTTDLAAMGQVGDFIMAVDTLVLSAVLAVYLGWMLLAGAKANESVAAHTAIILSKQVEATQALASYETRRDSMLAVGAVPTGQHARRAAASALKWRHAVSMLEVVRQSLGYEEPLTVLGFPASYGFAQSVGSAAVTAQSVVVTLLNDKYGWLSFGRGS